MLRDLYENQTQRSVDIAWRRVHHPDHDWASLVYLASPRSMKQEDGAILYNQYGAKSLGT